MAIVFSAHFQVVDSLQERSKWLSGYVSDAIGSYTNR
uniref:Transposase n=1 Tax=Ascaris lumbricoides TaxID=6252 RepID=A0A0M3IC11_ASCLU